MDSAFVGFSVTCAGDGCIVVGDELIHRGAPQSGIEERLRE
jgi:hypothetical protein